MEFINRIIEYFSTYDVGNLAQDIISFLATFFLITFILGYAAKHHGGWYSGIIVTVIVIVAALTLLGLIREAYVGI